MLLNTHFEIYWREYNKNKRETFIFDLFTELFKQIFIVLADFLESKVPMSETHSGFPIALTHQGRRTFYFICIYA